MLKMRSLQRNSPPATLLEIIHLAFNQEEPWGPVPWLDVIHLRVNLAGGGRHIPQILSERSNLVLHQNKYRKCIPPPLVGIRSICAPWTGIISNDE